MTNLDESDRIDFDKAPTEKKERIQWLLDRIFELRKKRLMCFDDLRLRLNDLDTKIEAARDILLKAPDKLEIIKMKEVIRSYTTQKQLCSERRYIIQKFHMDIAELEKELLKLRI